MACGGVLTEIPKEQGKSQVTAGTFARIDHFCKCSRCGRLFWQGKHWQRIDAILKQVSVDSTVGLNHDSTQGG